MYESVSELKHDCMHAKSLSSCQTLQPCGPWPSRLLCPWDSPGKNARVGCHVLLQVTFPTQGLNPRFCIAGGFLTAESLGQSMAAGVGPRQGSKSYWWVSAWVVTFAGLSPAHPLLLQHKTRQKSTIFSIQVNEGHAHGISFLGSTGKVSVGTLHNSKLFSAWTGKCLGF